jgi:hypothetical protein
MKRAFIFCCPATGQNVQTISEWDDEPTDGMRRYQGVHCLACQMFHIVNPATGRLLSEETEE